MRRRPSILFALVAVLALFGAAVARADEEKRSAIVEAEGEVVFGETQTRAQVREAAKAQALQKALDRGGGQIRALTQVEDLEFKGQQIEKEAAANYRIVEEKDLGMTATNTYKYWIKAEMRYVIPDSNSISVRKALASAAAPLTVRVWTARKTYRAGEKVEIQVEGNKPFFGAIFYEDAGGTLVQLLPNIYRNANQFEAKVPITLPGEGDRFELKVEPPFGNERITVFASTCPLGRATLQAAAGQGLQIAQVTRGQLERQMRGIGVAGTSGGSGSAALGPTRPTTGANAPGAAAGAGGGGQACQGATEFYEATWDVTTRP
jgi:hypothetical protein